MHTEQMSKYTTDAAGVLRSPEGKPIVTLGDIEDELNRMLARCGDERRHASRIAGVLMDTVVEGRHGAALADVAAERDRQKTVEGWSEENDDGHEKGELSRAACVYALNASFPDAVRQDILRGRPNLITNLWPWDMSWYKPTTKRRDLVKSCALLVAEIERLDRREAAQNLEKTPFPAS